MVSRIGIASEARPLAEARVRYAGDVPVAGRRREMEQIARLLERARGGAGGLLILVGPAGSGKTAMAEAAAGQARRRGFDVLRAAPAGGQPGRLVWAQLLRDAAAPDGLAADLIGGDAGPLDLDSAARHLVSRSPRLIVVDDVDRGGPAAVEVLSVVAARCAAASTAVIATAAAPLGLGPELRLGALNEEGRGRVGQGGSALIDPGRARLLLRRLARCAAARPGRQRQPAAGKIGGGAGRDHPALHGLSRPPARLELACAVGEGIGCLIDECKETERGGATSDRAASPTA